MMLVMMVMMKVKMKKVMMTDNYADADDDEQGGREELCWGVQEPGLL